MCRKKIYVCESLRIKIKLMAHPHQLPALLHSWNGGDGFFSEPTAISSVLLLHRTVIDKARSEMLSRLVEKWNKVRPAPTRQWIPSRWVGWVWCVTYRVWPTVLWVFLSDQKDLFKEEPQSWNIFTYFLEWPSIMAIIKMKITVAVLSARLCTKHLYIYIYITSPYTICIFHWSSELIELDIKK